MLSRVLVFCVILISSLSIYAETPASDSGKIFISYGYDLSRFSSNQPINVATGFTLNNLNRDNTSSEWGLGYKRGNFGLQILASLFHDPSYTLDKTNPYSTCYVYQNTFNIGLDGLYFYSLNSRFVLKGLLGLGYLRTSLENNAYYYSFAQYYSESNKFITNGIGVRAGGGLQILLIYNTWVDLGARIQAPGNKAIKNVLTGNIALTYYF